MRRKQNSISATTIAWKSIWCSGKVMPLLKIQWNNVKGTKLHNSSILRDVNQIKDRKALTHYTYVIILTFALLSIASKGFSQCGYNNTNSGITTTPCIDITSNVNSVSTNFACHQYFTLNVIKGLTYQIYTCNVANPAQRLRMEVYNDANQALLVSSNSNTGNPCTNQNNNVYLSWTATLSGSVRVNIYRNNNCNSTTPAGLTVNVDVSGGSNTQDDQSSAGTNGWIGHIYDGGTSFNNYLGYYTQTETFQESFGTGGTWPNNNNDDATCFNVYSNGVIRAYIRDVSSSFRYRMNSTRRGLYVASLTGDDGNRLTVDGTQVYSDWSDHSPRTNANVLFSLSGSSALIFEYYENGGQNVVGFTNLTQVFSNTLSTNTDQTICLGGIGSAISGDVFGTLPTGISISGTGYQWAYSASTSGPWIDILGATSATYTPSTSATPFNSEGTYYLIRKAMLSSSNNVSPTTYVATNESNYATLVVTSISAPIIGAITQPTCATATGSVALSGLPTTTWTVTANPVGSTISGSSNTVDFSGLTANTTYTFTVSSSGCSSAASSSAVINAQPITPTAVTVTGGGTHCGSATINAAGGSGGTIYFQGITSGGTSTANTSTSQLISTSGIYYFRARSATGCWGSESSAAVTINSLPPDFSGTIVNSTCPTSTDGSIKITDLPSPLVFVSGESDQINMGSKLLSNRSAFTLEGWVFFNSSDLANRMSLFGQNNVVEFGFSSSTNLQCWTQSGGSANYASIASYSGGWHHIAAVGNGANILLYIDGNQVSSGGANTSSYGNNADNNSMIGGGVFDASGGNFNGQILKVGFWSTALSASSITSLASGLHQYSGSDSGLLAGFNFFEGTSGTTIASVGSSASTITLSGPSWSDYFTYNWTVTGNSTTIATTKDISGIAANDYTLTISNGTCTNSADFTVGSDNISAVVSLTSASGTDAQTVCANAPITEITYSTSGANSVSITGLPTGISDAWFSNIITISGSTSVTTGSPFTYTITANGDCGSTTETGTITVNTLPIASISGNNSPVCSGNNATFTLTGTSGATVTYNINGGTPSTAVLTSGTATVTISAATSDQTLYLVSVTDGTCSQNLSGSSAVTVNSLPVSSFTVYPGPSECQGDDVDYTTEPLMTNYTWSVPGTDGIDYSITSGDTDSNTVRLKWLTTGSKTVTVGYTDGNGCASATPASSTITVNPTPVIGTFN